MAEWLLPLAPFWLAFHFATKSPFRLSPVFGGGFAWLDATALAPLPPDGKFINLDSFRSRYLPSRARQLVARGGVRGEEPSTNSAIFRFVTLQLCTIHRSCNQF